jgi:hypothetical protein
MMNQNTLESIFSDIFTSAFVCVHVIHPLASSIVIIAFSFFFFRFVSTKINITVLFFEANDDILCNTDLYIVCGSVRMC